MEQLKVHVWCTNAMYKNNKKIQNSVIRVNNYD
jgi:hypothetical protein